MRKRSFFEFCKNKNSQVEEINVKKQVDTIKADLLEVRRHIIEVSGIEFEQQGKNMKS